MFGKKAEFITNLHEITSKLVEFMYTINTMFIFGVFEHV